VVELSTIDLPARERIEEHSIIFALIQLFHRIVRACVSERRETTLDLL
jgi:hypothetical protein